MPPTGKSGVAQVHAVDDAPDRLDSEEPNAFASADDLEKVEKTRAHSRRETFRDQYHIALLLLFWGFFCTLAASGLIWAWHLLTPPIAHFLLDAQLDKIQSTFFTGIVSAGLSIGFRTKYLD